MGAGPMTTSERILIENIIRREGGYVNHPADRGGPTNYGITIWTMKNRYPELSYRELHNKVKTLRQDEAALIYRDEYYLKPKLYKLPTEIRSQMTDMAVNIGPGKAVQLMQEILNVKPDGIIGPETSQKAYEILDGIGPERFNNALVEKRKNHYMEIVTENPSQAVFLKGWLNRANEFKSE